jgi:putative PIN family toxin of toxin-antitoxin system
MRVVLDTNVLISALLVGQSTTAQLLTAWRRGAFELLTCELQLQEIRAVTRRDKVRTLIRPALAGEMINQLRDMAIWIETLPRVDRSADPFDNFLLAMAEGGTANVLVSGDKRGLLALKNHGSCRIVTVREFVAQISP